MVVRGGIDHRIGGLCLDVQYNRVIEQTDDWLDAMGRNQFGLRLVTDQTANAKRALNHDKTVQPIGAIDLIIRSENPARIKYVENNKRRQIQNSILIMHVTEFVPSPERSWATYHFDLPASSIFGRNCYGFHAAAGCTLWFWGEAV